MTTSTLKDLVKQRDAIAAQIAEARIQEIARMRETISEMGLTSDDLFKKQRAKKTNDSVSEMKPETEKKAHKPVPPKYTDGVNFWSGRGKAPRWVATAKESGSFKEIAKQ